MRGTLVSVVLPEDSPATCASGQRPVVGLSGPNPRVESMPRTLRSQGVLPAPEQHEGALRSSAAALTPTSCSHSTCRRTRCTSPRTSRTDDRALGESTQTPEPDGAFMRRSTCGRGVEDGDRGGPAGDEPMAGPAVGSDSHRHSTLRPGRVRPAERAVPQGDGTVSEAGRIGDLSAMNAPMSGGG
jgi:hypothetical protein